MNINTLSSDILLLICSNLDDLSYVHLYLTCRRYHSLLKSELFLRTLFRSRGSSSLSVQDLQRGFSFIISRHTNEYRKENTGRMIAGLYRIDIFGRLFRKYKHLDNNIVEIQSLFIPRESCLTLSGTGALVMRIMGDAQPRHIADNVKWFCLSGCGDIILCREEDKLYSYDISSKIRRNKHLYGSIVDTYSLAIDDIIQIEASADFSHSPRQYLILTKDGILLLSGTIIDRNVTKIVHIRSSNECSYYYLKGSVIYFRRLYLGAVANECFTCVADIEQMGPACFKIIYLDGTCELRGRPCSSVENAIDYQ